MPTKTDETIIVETPAEAVGRVMKRVTEDSPNYYNIEVATQKLATLFDETGPSDPEDLRIFASATNNIGQALGHLFKDLSTNTIIILYPTRGEIFRTLTKIQYEALGRIPFEELSVEEKELYIKCMVSIHGEHYDKYRGRYYCFGFLRPYFEKPKDRELLEAIGKNEDRVLSDEEIDIVYQAEKDTYKIHLNVPPERKLEVLKALLAVQEEDNRIVRQIFDEKKEAGQPVSASRRELKERGARLASLNQYKMSEIGLDNSLTADFVFYPLPAEGQTPQEALVLMVHELNDVLAGLNLPPTGSIPRFSTPVTIDGKEIPGMTFVQGNGDLKTHLLITLGPDKLSQYYDRARNWAVRKETEISF